MPLSSVWLLLLLGVWLHSAYCFELYGVDVDTVFATYPNEFRISGTGFTLIPFFIEVTFCDTQCDKLNVLDKSELHCVMLSGTLEEDKVCDLKVEIKPTENDVSVVRQMYNALNVKAVALGTILPTVLYFDTPMQQYISFSPEPITVFPDHAVITLGGQPCKILSTSGTAVLVLVTPKDGPEHDVLRIVVHDSGVEYMIASGTLRTTRFEVRDDAVPLVFNILPPVFYSDPNLLPEFQVYGSFPSGVQSAVIHLQPSGSLTLASTQISDNVFQFAITNVNKMQGKLDVQLLDKNLKLAGSSTMLLVDPFDTVTVIPSACLAGEACKVRVHTNYDNSVPFMLRANTVTPQLAKMLKRGLNYVDFEFFADQEVKGSVPIDLISSSDLSSLRLARLCEVSILSKTVIPTITNIFPLSVIATGFQDIGLYGQNLHNFGETMNVVFHSNTDIIKMAGSFRESTVPHVHLKLSPDCFQESQCKPGLYTISINGVDTGLTTYLMANAESGVRYYAEMAGYKGIEDMLRWSSALCNILGCHVSELIGGTIYHRRDVTTLSVILTYSSSKRMSLEDAVKLVDNMIFSDATIRDEFDITGEQHTYGGYSVSFCPAYAEHRHFCDREDPVLYIDTLDSVDEAPTEAVRAPLPFWAIMCIALLCVFGVSAIITSIIVFFKRRAVRKAKEALQHPLLAVEGDGSSINRV